MLRNTLSTRLLTHRPTLIITHCVMNTSIQIQQTGTTEEKINRPQSFRLFLQNELLNRCRKNPGYSLRSFARILQISPSSLSRILNGERIASPAMKAKLRRRLSIDPQTFSQLSDDVSSNAEQKRTADFQQLAMDTFNAIADWYHYAILELTNVKGFESNPRWIAKTLGITISEANAAIERLQRLGMLVSTEDGRWINRSGNNTNADGDITASACRKLQRQVLEMALKALEEVPVTDRDQSSMTLAIKRERMPEAIEKITQFRREFTQFLEQDSERDAVFQLGISFYPLTRPNNKRNSHENP